MVAGTEQYLEILKSFQTSDALLLAIDEEYVEGVELLLEHEERIWKVRKMKVSSRKYYTMAQIYRYIDVMITHYKMAGDHNVDVSIDLGHTVCIGSF